MTFTLLESGIWSLDSVVFYLMPAMRLPGFASEFLMLAHAEIGRATPTLYYRLRIRALFPSSADDGACLKFLLAGCLPSYLTFSHCLTISATLCPLSQFAICFLCVLFFFITCRDVTAPGVFCIP